MLKIIVEVLTTTKSLQGLTGTLYTPLKVGIVRVQLLAALVVDRGQLVVSGKVKDLRLLVDSLPQQKQHSHSEDLRLLVYNNTHIQVISAF